MKSNLNLKKYSVDDDFGISKITRKSGESFSRVLRLMDNQDPRVGQQVQKLWDVPPPENEWNWKTLEEGIEDQENLKKPVLINFISAKKQGYSFEFGSKKNATLTPSCEIEDEREELPWYERGLLYKVLKNPDHCHFLTDVEGTGPVCITIDYSAKKSGKASRTRALVRTKFYPSYQDRIFIPASISQTKEILKFIKEKHPKLKSLEYSKLLPLREPALNESLLNFERNQKVRKCKIGLLYVKDKQVNENEMFSNVDESPDFQEFLQFIGTKVKLEGFTGYNGGLDVKTNTTGTYSIFSHVQDYEIMFHISTYLPFQTYDKQRIERKRHIGNDVVVLIFKEGNTPFDPLCLTSQFNHAFIVVQVAEKKANNTIYKISVANKPGVRPYGPFLKSPPLYEKNEDFKLFLLTKLINAERGSMASNQFRANLVSTRKAQLQSLLDTYTVVKKHRKFDSTDLRSNVSNHISKVESFGETSEASEVVAIGKELLQMILQEDLEQFNISLFTVLLQKIFKWALRFPQKGDDLLPLYAGQIADVGEKYVELLQSRRAKVDFAELEDLKGKMRQQLSLFFMTLKEHMETNSPKPTDKKTEAYRVLQDTLDSFDLTSECVSDSSTFDVEAFLQRLKGNARQVMSLTRHLEDDVLAQKLVDATKLLLEKGKEIPTEPSQLPAFCVDVNTTISYITSHFLLALKIQ